MCECSAGLHHMHPWFLWGHKRALDPLKPELPMCVARCWGSVSGILEEESVVLTVELPLLTLSLFLVSLVPGPPHLYSDKNSCFQSCSQLTFPNLSTPTHVSDFVASPLYTVKYLLFNIPSDNVYIPIGCVLNSFHHNNWQWAKCTILALFPRCFSVTALFVANQIFLGISFQLLYRNSFAFPFNNHSG